MLLLLLLLLHMCIPVLVSLPHSVSHTMPSDSVSATRSHSHTRLSQTWHTHSHTCAHRWRSSHYNTHAATRGNKETTRYGWDIYVRVCWVCDVCDVCMYDACMDVCMYVCMCPHSCLCMFVLYVYVNISCAAHLPSQSVVPLYNTASSALDATPQHNMHTNTHATCTPATLVVHIMQHETDATAAQDSISDTTATATATATSTSTSSSPNTSTATCTPTSTSTSPRRTAARSRARAVRVRDRSSSPARARFPSPLRTRSGCQRVSSTNQARRTRARRTATQAPADNDTNTVAATPPPMLAATSAATHTSASISPACPLTLHVYGSHYRLSLTDASDTHAVFVCEQRACFVAASDATLAYMSRYLNIQQALAQLPSAVNRRNTHWNELDKVNSCSMCASHSMVLND